LASNNAIGPSADAAAISPSALDQASEITCPSLAASHSFVSFVRPQANGFKRGIRCSSLNAND